MEIGAEPLEWETSWDDVGEVGNEDGGIEDSTCLDGEVEEHHSEHVDGVVGTFLRTCCILEVGTEGIRVLHRGDGEEEDKGRGGEKDGEGSGVGMLAFHSRVEPTNRRID